MKKKNGTSKTTESQGGLGCLQPKFWGGLLLLAPCPSPLAALRCPAYEPPGLPRKSDRPLWRGRFSVGSTGTRGYLKSQEFSYLKKGGACGWPLNEEMRRVE
jgi:hypothetical protein